MLSSGSVQWVDRVVQSWSPENCARISSGATMIMQWQRSDKYSMIQMNKQTIWFYTFSSSSSFFNSLEWITITVSSSINLLHQCCKYSVGTTNAMNHVYYLRFNQMHAWIKFSVAGDSCVLLLTVLWDVCYDDQRKEASCQRCQCCQQHHNNRYLSTSCSESSTYNIIHRLGVKVY